MLITVNNWFLLMISGT